MLVKWRIGKGVDGIGNIMSRGLDRDVIIIGKVDASLLLRRIIRDTKKLTLKARVGRARNVFAIAPLAVARATSGATSVASAATTGSFAVAVGVEATISAIAVSTPPSICLPPWGESLSIRPVTTSRGIGIGRGRACTSASKAISAQVL